MSPMSAEATVVRNYLDWLLAIPWSKKSKIKKDLVHAQEILDHDHYGLDKVKERIVEYLAVQTRANKLSGSDLLSRRSAGRRQNFAWQIDRACDGARVRARVAWRRARRGGNPRSPANLYWVDARQDHPVDAQGQEFKSAVLARRGRQDGIGFPRRPLVCIVGGSRSQSKTTPSTTTISRSIMISQMSCSLRRRTL